MAVREMKMIPDEVGVVGLALLGLHIGIEASNGHGVGIQSPQRNVFLFQEAVCGLFALISVPPLICGESSQQLSPQFSFNV